MGNINKKLNIAMFTNNYLPFIAGVSISVKRLSESLRKEGQNVYVFAPTFPQKDASDNKFIIRIKPLFYYRTGKIRFPVSNIFSTEIEKKFCELDIDIVHIHHPFWLGWLGLRLAKKYNKPVVLTFHTRLDQYAHYLPIFRTVFKKVVSHYLIKSFAQKCDVIFAPTDTAKNYLDSIGVDKPIEVFPTGIDLDKYKNMENSINKQFIREKNTVILYSIARLSKEKNIYFMLESLKYIKQNTLVNFKLYLAGDGPEKEKLIKKIKEYQLEDNIELLGALSQEDIIINILNADLFVFSSKSETQGMVLLEAMAGGLPVVAINATGIEDVVHNDFNGYKTQDNIEDWSSKVIALLENPNKLNEFSKNAKAFSKEYSVEKIAQKALKAYFSADRLAKHKIGGINHGEYNIKENIK